MELDPIVLLAYVSVALNLLTMVAAAATYLVFWLRRRSRQARPLPQAALSNDQAARAVDAPFIFFQRYIPLAERTQPVQPHQVTS